MTNSIDLARGPRGGLTPYLLMRMAQGGAYPSQVAIAAALGVTPARISLLKQQAVREGVFREAQWQAWMEHGQFTEAAREYYLAAGLMAGARYAS